MRLRTRLLVLGSLPVMALPFGWHMRPVVVIGDSMQPTLHSGQVIWMRRWHAGAPLHRGDIVVFRHDGGMTIKRVIGLPGDVVPRLRFRGGTYVYPDEMTGNAGKCMVKMLHRGSVVRDPVYVPTNCLYAMGDNRTASWDSRDFGPVPVREVLGVVPARPQDRARLLLAKAW